MLAWSFKSVFQTVQGEVEFRSVLYVPGMGPLNNEDVINPKTKNIRLYVKRVFISDDFDGELVSFSIWTLVFNLCRQNFAVFQILHVNCYKSCKLLQVILTMN